MHLKRFFFSFPATFQVSEVGLAVNKFDLGREWDYWEVLARGRLGGSYSWVSSENVKNGADEDDIRSLKFETSVESKAKRILG
jgi:hypothetical protein